jgi:hypothetical protein
MDPVEPGLSVTVSNPSEARTATANILRWDLPQICTESPQRCGPDRIALLAALAPSPAIIRSAGSHQYQCFHRYAGPFFFADSVWPE